MAGATAAAAASTAAGEGWRGAARGTVTRSAGSKDGKLDASFLTGTFRAGNFLLLVDDNFLEACFAFIANVFVDRHALFSSVRYISRILRPSILPA